MRIRAVLATLLGLCFVPSAHAEDPFAPSKFLGEEGLWRLHLSSVYSNSENSTVTSGASVLVQTGTGQFVQVPTTLSAQNSNTDSLMLIPGVSYGLGDGTEIGLNISGRSMWTRSETADRPVSNNTTQFLGAAFNISHTFAKSRKDPFLVGFLDTSLANNVAAQGTDFVYGKSINAGVMVYKLFDPVVLSATTLYQYNRPRTVNGENYKPGNMLVLSPAVYFKANMFVSFSSGLTWSLQQGDQTTGYARSLSHTQLSLDYSLGYAWSEDVSLVVSANTNISGGSGASVVLTASYYLLKDTTAAK